jgi:hypothetical protein
MIVASFGNIAIILVFVIAYSNIYTSATCAKIANVYGHFGGDSVPLKALVRSKIL